MAPTSPRTERIRVATREAARLGEMAAFLEAQRIEARFDSLTRILYSTDASNHQIVPLGVAFPRRPDEVAAIVEKAAALRLPILPRGAGTSLGGQAIGACLILDTGRHMNRIISIDPERRSAIVEPGVVCQALNEASRKHGMQYGPDPASADRATFGGMLGNNATGAHSIRYGMTSDHVLRSTLVAGDGSTIRFEAMDASAARPRASGASLEAEVLRTALELRQELSGTIDRNWPQTWRRASGYGLNYLVGYTPGAPASWYRASEPYLSREWIDLPGMLCGSEGTLGVFVEAEVRLVPRPAATTLVLMPFSSVAEACETTVGLLETEPSAVELIPAAIVERARAIPGYARRLGFLETVPKALLAVEYEGASLEEASARARPLHGAGIVLDDARRQAEFWEVRKAGLGLLMSVPGDTKPITFIEDVAVPVDRLPEYVRSVDAILAEHGTTGEWYAHASAGCLHLRPMVNLKSDDGRRQMRSIADAIVEQVFRLRGAVSGEHGDGLSHSEFNERLFGPELTDAFRRVKRAFDPLGILNPGKVVVQPGDPIPRIDGDLRYADRGAPPIRLRTQFAYSREQSLLRAVEDCSGVGVCRKSSGVMCPSFQATRNERDSTRGRANALRAALSGWLPEETLFRPEMHAVLELCLECKGCKAECPTGVDMARLKAEFLYHYQRRNGVPLRSRLLGRPDRMLAIARHAAPIHNRIRRSRAFRRLTQAAFGIDRRRMLPELRRTRLRDRLEPIEAARSDQDTAVLFIDTLTDLSEPEVGLAAAGVLRSAGVNVGRAPGQVCCGRPMISKGLLNDAKAAALRNLDALGPYAEAGIPIVGLEPSCLLTLRDEYLEFFPDDPRARKVAAAARLLEEFLLDPDPAGTPRVDRIAWKPAGEAALVHNHCHAKALIGSGPLLEVLGRVGAVRETSAGCCGMAGTFGYEAEHYALSMEIGEMRLLPEVRAAAGRGEVAVAAGLSCRTQIRDGAAVEALHPAVYLAGRLGER